MIFRAKVEEMKKRYESESSFAKEKEKVVEKLKTELIHEKKQSSDNLLLARQSQRLSQELAPTVAELEDKIKELEKEWNAKETAYRQEIAELKEKLGRKADPLGNTFIYFYFYLFI
jgi:hypothetical protein